LVAIAEVNWNNALSQIFADFQVRNSFGELGALLAAVLISTSACGADSVKVANAWVRAPAPGQKTASAYMDLTSDGNAALVAAGSIAAARAELHSTSTEGGIMRMRPLARVDLPAGQTVTLAPGGTHLMLVDLKQALKPGDKVPIVLSVQPAGPTAGKTLTTVTLEAEVRAATATPHNH
jgi:copper(I)-binding protein